MRIPIRHDVVPSIRTTPEAPDVQRKFGLCRICLRNIAHEGLIPGVKKSSW